jgi:hypothetical protein
VRLARFTTPLSLGLWGCQQVWFKKEVLTMTYCVRFAVIAVKKGFITVEQAKAALLEQIDDDISGEPHRLVGSILFEKGWITPEQIDMVLDELFQKAS